MVLAVAEEVPRSVAPDEVVRITFNSDNQARGLHAHFCGKYDLIFLGGGVNSGKTFLFGVQLDWRARPRNDGRGAAETNQVGALFVNSLTTFRAGIYDEVCRLYRKLGREAPTYNRQPSAEWQRRWAQQGIEIPSIPSYAGILTTPDGVHVAVASLHDAKSMHQIETLNLAWAWIEEAINNALHANETVKERIRCSLGGISNPDCAKYHNHTTTWVFNPPRGAHPYLYRKLDELEQAATNFYHGLADGAECDGCFYVDDDGEKHPRAHGPLLNHRDWPLLRQGVGDAIWIRSRTIDNHANQNKGFRSKLTRNLSKDAARRRLEGEILRENTGRAYADFTDANLWPVGYDADRTLYLCLDFNLAPRAAVFAHPLNPGEYPAEHERNGVTHIGVFGEYVYAAEKDDRKFALDLVRGERGTGGDLQAPYRSEEWRGLPPPCDERCEQPCYEGHWNGLKAHRGPIVAFGDQRATYRSSHAADNQSSWDIVERVFFTLGNYGRDVPEEQPTPRSRVDSVNAKACDHRDLRSLWVDPRCEELIRDFEQVMWNDEGKALREWRLGAEILRTHLTDGLGYMIHRLFPGGDDDTGMAAVATTIERGAPKRERRAKYPLTR